MRDMDRNPITTDELANYLESALILSKSLMVNWSNGLWFTYVINCIYIYFDFCIGH